MSRRALRIGLPAAALIALALAAWRLELQRFLEPEALRSLIEAAGLWGPVLFVALFSVLEAMGVPGAVFMLAGVAIWEPGTAFLLNWMGGVGAGIVGFWFARTLGREWVAARLPERVRRFERRVERRGFQTVVVFRLVFFLFPPAHWALGLSPVAFGPFVLGTAVGLAPGIAAWSFGGGAAVEWLGRQPPSVWIAIAAACATAWGLRQWLRRPALSESSPEGSPPADTPPRA